MTTKLTLTMDGGVILKAKEYVKTRHTSISALVENWLDRISAGGHVPVSQIRSPLVDSMCGVIPDDGRDYRELLDEALAERFARKGFGID